MKPRICIRCHKEIKQKENHLQIIEWNNNKLIKETFIHKSCWEEMMTVKGGVRMALGLLKGLKKKANELGISEEVEEIII